MDGFRDRLNGRYDRTEKYDRGVERERSDYDRYDRPERSRRSSSDMDSSIGEVIDRSNRSQLEAIADLFDEARDDRLESEKVIVRAVDDNAQMLSDIAKALKNMQGGNMGAVAPVPTQSREEEFFDSPSVDPSAKDEILRVVGDNKQLLTLIRQDVITIAQNQSQDGQAALSEPADMPDFLLASAADQYYKDMEEHVHKENVKCYKNIQAAITEQNGESVKEFTKSLSGIKIISILSLVFSAMTLILLVASVFGLI